MYRLLVKNIYPACRVNIDSQRRSMFKAAVMFCGIIIMGLSIALIRMSDFGTDPFTCMNLGISSSLGVSFGNWQLLLNGVILGFVYWKGKSLIGLGTIVNMAGVGYLADMFTGLLDIMGLMGGNLSLLQRVVLLICSILLTTLGVAFYMAADLGVAPYDACGIIFEGKTNGRIPFRVSRIFTDIICVAIGVVCGSTVGLGTIILAFFTGPLVQFFKERVAMPLLTK